MTRDEAIQKVTIAGFAGFHADHLVAALESVGLLKLDAIDDATFRAAGERLEGAFVSGDACGGTLHVAAVRLDRAGAYEVLDVLRKSGFKLTGPEK